MKLTGISYQKTFNLGNYCSEKIGFDAELETGDDPKLELIKLRAMAEQQHKETNPQLFNGSMPSYNEAMPITQIEKNISPSEKMIREINTCKDVIVLETYKFLVKGKPELQTAYDDKLKTLSNGLEQN